MHIIASEINCLKVYSSHSVLPKTRRCPKMTNAFQGRTPFIRGRVVK